MASWYRAVMCRVGMVKNVLRRSNLSDRRLREVYIRLVAVQEYMEEQK